MGRYSPTVLPRAFDFGGILERALQGYRYGRGLRREREEERDREEDRRLLRERMRREDLSQPGAATLSEYLDVELGAGREPLTKETLGRVGRADEPDVELEFRRPEPTTVTLPGGKTRQFQERAPFTTETGVVIDPRRAREERGLAAYMDASMLREPVRKPWEREGFETEPEYLGYLGRKRKAEPPREARPPITLNQALDAVDRLYGVWDPDTQVYTYPFPEEQRYKIARSMVMGAETIPGKPEPPLPVAPPIRARPLGEDRESGVGGIFRRIGEFFRGGERAGQATGGPGGAGQATGPGGAAAPPGRPTRPAPGRAPAPDDRVSQARALVAQYADLNLSAEELEGVLADEGFTPEEIQIILGGGSP